MANKTVKQIAEWLEETVQEAQTSESTCFWNQIGDSDIYLCIGWVRGYEDDGTTIVQDGYGLCAALKVITSDYLKDFEYLNFPYYNSGDCWDTTVSFGHDEDYDGHAKWFLSEYEAMEKLEIDSTGLILNYKSPEDYCAQNNI